MTVLAGTSNTMGAVMNAWVSRLSVSISCKSFGLTLFRFVFALGFWWTVLHHRVERTAHQVLV